MTGKFIFWAQALDNASPDHIEMWGEELSPTTDTARRQAAVSRVSNVVKTGRRMIDTRGVQLTADDHHFVMEVASAQRDRAGRTAPIVCYGEWDSTVGNTLGASVAVGLDHFAKQIGRSLQAEHLEVVRESFMVLKKNSSTRKLGRVVALGATGLVMLGLVWWLYSKGS